MSLVRSPEFKMLPLTRLSSLTLKVVLAGGQFAAGVDLEEGERSIVGAVGIEGGAAGGEGAVDEDLRRRRVAGHEADRRPGDVHRPVVGDRLAALNQDAGTGRHTQRGPGADRHGTESRTAGAEIDRPASDAQRRVSVRRQAEGGVVRTGRVGNRSAARQVDHDIVGRGRDHATHPVAGCVPIAAGGGCCGVPQRSWLGRMIVNDWLVSVEVA